MKIIYTILTTIIVLSNLGYATAKENQHITHRADYGVPIDVCFDRRLLGTWRRYGDQVNQQLTYFPDGWVSGFTDNDPTKMEGSGSGSTNAEGAPIGGGNHSDCNPFILMGATSEFGGGKIIVDKNGLGLTFIPDGNQEIKTPVRFRKIIPLPKIDWTKTAHDGGYLWDFRHRCTDNIPRKLTIRGFANDNEFFATDIEPPHQVFAGDSDGTLWWSFNEKDPLQKRNYCQPNDHTLIVAQPGPRGVVLPHVYDVYDFGGTITLNGVGLELDPRWYMTQMTPRIIFDKERPINSEPR